MKRIFYRLFFVLTMTIPVVAVLCFVLLVPAFAGMKKVDEAELSRTNASVTGAPVKDQNVGIENVLPETWQAIRTVDTGDAGFSPSLGKAEGTGVDTNINGQKTFQFFMGPTTTNLTGGITSVKPR